MSSLTLTLAPLVAVAVALAGPAGPLAAQGDELMDAVYREDVAAVQRLVAAGADVHAEVMGWGSTPLEQAMSQNSGAIVRVLAEAGADVDQRVSRGRTLLMVAVIRGHMDVVRALVDAGADLRLVDRNDLTALDEALDEENLEAVALLAAAGAPLDRHRGPAAGTLLHDAVSSGSSEAVGLLLDHGASPNVTDLLVNTPLIMAAARGDTEMVELLLAAGADPDLTNSMGATARQMATMGQHSGTVSALDGAGAAAGASEFAGQDEMREAMQENAMRIQEEKNAERESLRENEPPPTEVDEDGAYPVGAGGFTGPCRFESENYPAVRPAPGETGFMDVTASSFVEGRASEETLKGDHLFGDIARAFGGDDGTNFIDLASMSMTAFDRDHTVGPPDCDPVTLGPGDYTMITHHMYMSWTWVLPDGMERCRPGVYCYVLEEIPEDEPVITRSYTHITADPTIEDGDRCGSGASLTIVSPAPDQDFAFGGQQRGYVEIPLQAEVSPGECADEVTWSADPMAGSEVHFRDGEVSTNRGSAISLVYLDLPADNGELGDKTITAHLGGRTERVTIQVFFPPQAKNHPLAPGDQRDTPNWLFYWAQTAAGGHDVFYDPGRRSEVALEIVQGQYDYTLDTLVVTDRVYADRCYPRPGGRGSSGIDCFGEILRHEGQHQKERWLWWGRTNPKALSEDAWEELDWDKDLVPDVVERALFSSRGCVWFLMRSCRGRPRTMMIDVEMDGYFNGAWTWAVGSADTDDWSSCGKQWDDPSVCAGGRRW